MDSDWYRASYNDIWSKRNTALVIGFCLTLAFILQSHVFLATDPKYTSGFGGCFYGFIGDFNLDAYASKTQSATVEFTAVFCTVLLFLTLIKLNMLYRQGAISSQQKKDLPLLCNPYCI
uniref:Uncharacterized protein n=1 Tax=Acrobeloides nanus TaxID=290746 RepID=A0A914DR11_9BILA